MAELMAIEGGRAVPLWQQVHSKVFSTPETRWWETYAIWTRIFSSEGWTDEQLVSAVYRVAQRAQLPKFAPDHLQAIRDELFAINAEARKHRDHAISRHECKDCKSTGMISGLPHPDHISEGRWVPHPLFGTHYTCAVTCHCPRGQAKKVAFMAHLSKDPRTQGKAFLEWDEYCRRNPNWQTQLEIRQALKDAEIKAGRENLPTCVDGIKSRLADAFAV